MSSLEKLAKADQIAERLNVQTITTLESERVLGRPLEGHAPNQRTSSRYGVCPRTDDGKDRIPGSVLGDTWNILMKF